MDSDAVRLISVLERREFFSSYRCFTSPGKGTVILYSDDGSRSVLLCRLFDAVYFGFRG